MDFSIFYNKADKPWADWIGWILEDAKYKVWTPDWDIHAGNNEVIEIQKVLNDTLAMEGKRRMILIVSPNLSNKTSQEISWTSLFSHDPDGRKGLLLPVVVDNITQALNFPSGTKFIDLTQNENEDSTVRKLMDGISRQRHKPSSRPKWPGKERPLFPGGVLETQPIQVDKIDLKMDLEAIRPPRPDYRVGLVDRASQRDHFVGQIPRMTCLSNGRTWGFILSGPRQEWPQAIRFKLAYGLEVDLIGDRKKAPELKLLNAEKSMVGKAPEQYLWELLAIAMECSVKEDVEEVISIVLSKQNQCHVFYRELSNEEAKDHKFLAGMLLGWSKLTLASGSPSHFLLLIRETEEAETLRHSWFSFIKQSLTWHQKMEEVLNKSDLAYCLLPQLETPTLEHVNDWLKRHVEDDLRDEIKALIVQKFPKSQFIPHAELKKVLLPFLQKYQSQSK